MLNAYDSLNTKYCSTNEGLVDFVRVDIEMIKVGKRRIEFACLCEIHFNTASVQMGPEIQLKS